MSRTFQTFNRDLEKEEETKPKESRRKVIIKIRADLHEKESTKQRKSARLNRLFKTINKMGKLNQTNQDKKRDSNY